jgi:hypothetical protein
VCSGAPAVQIAGGISIPGWGGSITVDDAYVTINLPVVLTLYSYSTSNVSVSSNGVRPYYSFRLNIENLI